VCEKVVGRHVCENWSDIEGPLGCHGAMVYPQGTRLLATGRVVDPPSGQSLIESFSCLKYWSA
jgi:hypothetical protein